MSHLSLLKLKIFLHSQHVQAIGRFLQSGRRHVTYTMDWGLSDYLDVLQMIVGTNYIYFTSNKPFIIEFANGWAGITP